MPTVLAVGTAAFVVLPLLGMVHQVSWGDFTDAMRQPATRQALWVSAKVSVGALAICVVFGLPMAWVLARRSFPGREGLRTLMHVPMVLPPVVSGLALLYAFGPKGLLGGFFFRHWGWRVTLTPLSAMLAAAFVAMPLLVISAEAAFRSLDGSAEEAASTLGASARFRFVHVTLPSLAPALSAGAAMCFARALGEFGATALFAGDMPGRTETMPLLIYQGAQGGDSQSATALSILLLVISLCILFLFRDRWRPE